MNRAVHVASMMAAIVMAATPVPGAEPVAGIAPCAGLTDTKSKSRLYFDGATIMTSLLTLEAQGEPRFHLTYAPPPSECVFEKFEVAALPVEAIHSPFEKGEQSLHWRFKIGGPEPREILALYDGMASFLAKKEIFFVVEERKGSISYYAMFRDQPTYAALRPLVVGILDGSAEPLARVRWPPGDKEPVIDAYDSKRLK